MKIGKNIFQPYTSTMHYVSLKYYFLLLFTGVKTYKERFLAMATLVMLLTALTLLNVQGSLAAFDPHLTGTLGMSRFLYSYAASSIILDGPFDLCI